MPNSKIPIRIGKQNAPSQAESNSDSAYFEFFLNLQENLKLFLSVLIIMNFIIIFGVKFLASVSKKVQNFFRSENQILNSSEESNPQSNEKIEKIGNVDNKATDKYDILLIIAHPDDEVVFFSPLLKLLSAKIDKDPERFNVRVLCLSNGNYDRIGKIREDEFAKVMKALKVKDFELINDERMQDDLHKYWDQDLVCEKISGYLEKSIENHNNKAKENEGKKILDSVTHILTFDENGVTKHPNHISCYNGLETFIKKNRSKLIEKNINIFLLDTHFPLLNYTLIIPFFIFYLKQFGFWNWNFLYAYRLMKLYATQYNWRRKLHTVFSSYTYVNNLVKVEINKE